MIRAFVALGANQAGGSQGGALQEQLAAALDQLRAVSQVLVVRPSPWYGSHPEGLVQAQADFVNGCAEVLLTAGCTPSAFLAELLSIEARLGRHRTGVRGGPRIIDLDLLLWNDATLDEPGPPHVILPHPRMHERLFVLVPLRDLAGPTLVVPGCGLIDDLIAAAPSRMPWALGSKAKLVTMGYERSN